MRTLSPRRSRTALALCSCGKLHFSYDSVTFHFEPAEFTAFAEAVAHLFAQYKQSQHEQQIDPFPAIHPHTCH